MPFYTPLDPHPDDVDAEIQFGVRVDGVAGPFCAQVRFQDGAVLHAPPHPSEADQHLNAVECLEGRLAWQDHRQALHAQGVLLTHRTTAAKRSVATLEQVHAMPLPAGSCGGLELDGDEAVMAIRAEVREAALDLVKALTESFDTRLRLKRDRRAAAVWDSPVALLWATAGLDASRHLVRASHVLGDNFAGQVGAGEFGAALDAMKALIEAGDLGEARRVWGSSEKPRLVVNISDAEAARPADWAWTGAAAGLGMVPDGHPLYEAIRTKR